MNICVTVNSKYMRYLYVMLISLFENNRKGSMKLFVISSDFSNEDETCIKELCDRFGHASVFIRPNDEDTDSLPQTFKENGNYYSREILFRLMIPELLPADIDRVLLLDVDLIINHSIEDLYNVDFEDYVFAAVPNMIMRDFQVYDAWRRWYPKNRRNWIHYNTGVLLWNLKKIRNDYPKKYIFDRAKENPQIEKPSFEEEFFNVEFGENDIKTIECKWNWQARVFFAAHLNLNCQDMITNKNDLQRCCSIVHYVDMNPWGPGNYNFATELWWEYCKKSRFYDALMWEGFQGAEAELNKTLEVDETADDVRSKGELIIELLKRMEALRVMLYGTGKASLAMWEILAKSEIEVLGIIEPNFYKREEFRRNRHEIPFISLAQVRNIQFDLDAVLVMERGTKYNDAWLALRKVTEQRVIPIVSLVQTSPFLTELEYRMGRYARIVLYGAGENGTKIYNYLKRSKRYELCAWVDRNFKKMGGKVRDPRILTNIDFDYVFISAFLVDLAEEIRKYLKEIGVSDRKIIWIPSNLYYVRHL